MIIYHSLKIKYMGGHLFMKKTAMLLGLMICFLTPIHGFAKDIGSFGINNTISTGLRTTLVIYIIGIFVALPFFLYARYHKAKNDKKTNLYNISVTIIYLSGLLTRFFIAPVFEGHPIDIACFKAWAANAAFSIPTFYTNGGFADYPPLYIYVLAIVENLRLTFFQAAPEWMHAVIIKMPAIAADVICSYFLYYYGKKFIEYKKALVIAFVYLFNPVTILNSSIWGQVDSFFMLILSLGVFALIEKKYIKSSFYYALAILTKPQGLIFLPVLFFLIVKEVNIKLFLKCLAAGITTFILPIIPFTGSQKYDWIVKLYVSTASSYKGASLNAYNLFALLGANWKEDTEKLFLFSYSTWGFIFIALITITTAVYIYLSKNAAVSPLASTLIITGVYLLSSKMHERYIFPVLMLLLIAYLLSARNELLVLYTGFTVTAFINILQVFTLSQSEIYWVPANDIILKAISLLNLILMAATFFIVFYRLKSNPAIFIKTTKVASSYNYKSHKGGK